jgi:peptidoglycan/LPS O-acetylase OafA/YrhL
LLVTHGAFFAIGIALWTIRAGITPLRMLTLGVGLVAGTIEIVSQAHFMATGLTLPAGPALPLGIFAAGVCAIAAAGALQAPLARWIGSGPLKIAGLATYPLYLIHQQAGFVVILWLTQHGVEGHLAMLGTAALALCVAIAIVRWAEPPLRRWLAARIDALSRRGSGRDTLPSASLPAG